MSRNQPRHCLPSAAWNSGGTGFWHETYLMRGGMEAIYDDVPVPVCMMSLAPLIPARHNMFGAAHRIGGAATPLDPVRTEQDLYG